MLSDKYRDSLKSKFELLLCEQFLLAVLPYLDSERKGTYYETIQIVEIRFLRFHRLSMSLPWPRYPGLRVKEPRRNSCRNISPRGS